VIGHPSRADNFSASETRAGRGAIAARRRRFSRLLRVLRPPAWAVRGLLGLVSITGAAVPSLTQVYKDNLPVDHAAIGYYQQTPRDRVTRLAEEIRAGKITLQQQPAPLGILPDLMKRLDLPEDSQMLVFSKTSFQAPKISPDNPRAIYFNEDVAIGYVRGSNALEVAALDPSLGPVFYEVTVDAAGKPAFQRNQACLQCHQGPNSAGVPGLYIGSVIPSPSGNPLRDDTAIVTDHRTEFIDRWGGWYVNAKRGEQPDRANAVAFNPADPSALVRDSQQNLTTLMGKFKPSGYLNAISDIIALMTYEHQTQMVNFITRVQWQSRLGQPADIEDLVSYMLFSREAKLSEPLEGVSTFTKTFPQRGIRDRRGRSLRDFDLQTRLLRYPLSYMIYSPSFDALAPEIRERIYSRLYEILTKDSAPYAYLSAAVRRAIIEIVRDTKQGIPDFWK
jgi:hypothetical protein